MHTSAIPTTSPERTVTATRPRPILRDVGREAQSCLGCSLRRICMPIDVADPEAKVLFENWSHRGSGCAKATFCSAPASGSRHFMQFASARARRWRSPTTATSR